MPSATITGKTKWFGYLNEPRENKYKEYARDWSLLVGVSTAEKLLFRQHKVKKKIKFDDDLGDCVTIDYLELDKKTKEPNDVVPVVDTEGNEWPKDKWIGNGSTIAVDINLKHYDFTTKEGDRMEGHSVIPTKITIVEHVPYVKKDDKGKTKRTDNVDWSDED